MKMHRAALGILALMGCLLGIVGCQGVLADLLASAPKPTASLENVKLRDIRADGVDLIADVKVDNPYPVPLYAKQLGFTLLSGETQMLSGTSDEALNVAAKSSNTVPVALTLPYKDVLAALKDVRPGQVVPFTTKFDVSMAGENVEPLNFNIEKSGELPVPAVPEVQVKGLKWQELSLAAAQGELGLSVKNTNQFPVNLAGMDYKFNLGGREISAGQLAEKALKLEPGQTGDLTLKFGMKPQDLGLAAFNMLRGDNADFELTGLMNAETPFGPMKLDYAKKGKTPMGR